MNQQVESFLEYYFARLEAPQYAVLLKGSWGSGKTWFIRQAIQKMPVTTRHLYVSLNGLASYGALETEIFRQLHPVLSSKGMEIAGKVLTGALKATLKIDLTGDGKDDGSIGINLPQISIPEYLTTNNSFVLIFDDLERCAMPIPEVLGYVNHFVEHGGYKVIILANEDEIVGAEKQKEVVGEDDAIGVARYKRIKEKLIGKEFQIEPSLVAAVDEFMKAISSHSAREIIAKHVSCITSTFQAGGHKNLRHVRQVLLDIERIVVVLPCDLSGHGELMQDFISQYLVFFTEVRSGALDYKDIAKIAPSFYKRFSGDKDKEGNDTLYSRLSKKYPAIDFLNELLRPEVWADLIHFGRIDASALEEAFRRSKYFYHAAQPTWVKLWHAYEMEDSDLQSVLVRATEEFENGTFTEKGVVLHLFGALLWLSSIAVSKLTEEKLVERMREHIDEMARQGLLGSVGSGRTAFEDTGYGGLGYHGKELAAFQKILDYVDEAIEREEKARAPEDARLLLEVMGNDADKFGRWISLTNEGDNKFYNKPILAKLPVEDFLSAFVSLRPEAQRVVQSAMRRRYEYQQRRSDLAIERPWLEVLNVRLRNLEKERAGTMLAYRLRVLADIIQGSVDLMSEPVDGQDSIQGC